MDTRRPETPGECYGDFPVINAAFKVLHVDAHPDLAASKAIESEDIFEDQLDLYTKLENGREYLSMP